MVLASHIIVSGLLASQTGNYFLAALIGFISHYILDAIPHWDNYLSLNFKPRAENEKGFLWHKFFIKEAVKIAVDIFAGLIILFLLFRIFEPVNVFPALIGIFFGILPDPLQLLYFITKWKLLKLNADFQYAIQKIKQGFALGVITQIATIALIFAATLYL